MDRSASRSSTSSCLLFSLFLIGMFVAPTTAARAQEAGQGGSANSQAAEPAGAERRGANPARGAAREAGQPRKEPSEAYRESIRQTVEKRRQRRANRGQGMGDSRPVGAIVPWSMPPVLIIRHSSEVHVEIESLLGLLRK